MINMIRKLSMKVVGAITEILYFWVGIDYDQYDTLTYHQLKTKIKSVDVSDYEILDGTVFLPTKRDIERLLTLNYYSNFKYVSTTRDCDDFARSLWGRAAEFMGGFAIGYVNVYNKHTKGKHALNFCIIKESDSLEWYYIEPQTNTLYHESEKPEYNPYRALI